MSLEEKVNAYKGIARQIEELEAQKKALGGEILELMPKNVDNISILQYRVKRVERFSIKTSLQEARAFSAVKMEEVVDKEKIKQLVAQGCFVPGVSEVKFIIVSQLQGVMASIEEAE